MILVSPEPRRDAGRAETAGSRSGGRPAVARLEVPQLRRRPGPARAASPGSAWGSGPFLSRLGCGCGCCLGQERSPGTGRVPGSQCSREAWLSPAACQGALRGASLAEPGVGMALPPCPGQELNCWGLAAAFWTESAWTRLPPLRVRSGGWAEECRPMYFNWRKS